MVRFWFRRAHALKFARALEKLEGMEKRSREAELTAARDRRIDQWDIPPCIACPQLSSLSGFRILERLVDNGWEIGRAHV